MASYGRRESRYQTIPRRGLGEDKGSHQSGVWLVSKIFHEFPKLPFKVYVLILCSDPLPFQCLSRYPEACQSVTFVDVDYMQLIIKKAEVIQQTAPLRQLLTNVKIPISGEAVTLRSDQYLAIGCDLREVEKLGEILAAEFDLENCLVLCTAEVSITYMDVHAADALIRWAATLRNGKSQHWVRSEIGV